MSQQRCTACYEPGHKRTAHDLAQRPSNNSRVKIWYAVAYDVSGVINGWCGPLPWRVAVAVARLWDDRTSGRARTRVTRKMAALGHASVPLPAGWEAYDPTRMDRGRRLQPATYRRAA